jgi:hypothetical protein
MIKEITPKEINERKVANLPTRPNNPRLYGGERLSPEQLKERFDALSLLAINRLNTLIAMINDGKISKEIPVLMIGEGDEAQTLTISELAEKVVDGTLPDIMMASESKSLRKALNEAAQAYQFRLDMEKVAEDINKDVSAVRNSVEEEKKIVDEYKQMMDDIDAAVDQIIVEQNGILEMQRELIEDDDAIQGQIDEILELQESYIGGGSE